VAGRAAGGAGAEHYADPSSRGDGQEMDDA
jgi:hypothetical protein